MTTERQRPARKVTTAWGTATLVDELTVPQRAGDKEFTCHLQLLEADDGETLVRFAYATDGVARRGPVTLRAADLEHVGAALASHPALSQALAGIAGARRAKGGGKR